MASVDPCPAYHEGDVPSYPINRVATRRLRRHAQYSLDSVWRKIESLGITEKDVEDAVRWARRPAKKGQEHGEMSRVRRTVIDTNVVVPAFVFRGGTLAWLREAIINGNIIPLVSVKTLTELVRVLGHPHLGLSAEDRENVLVQYMEHAEAVRNPRARAAAEVPRPLR